MRTTAFVTIAAAALSLAAPAGAQLLGGGLTGGLDRVLSGSLNARIASSVDKTVDHRSGRVAGKASADTTLGGMVDSAAGTTGPGGGKASAVKSVRAEKRASKSASVGVDGLGTDDGHGLISGVTGTAHGALGGMGGAAHEIAGAAQERASANGSASGSGNATSSGMLSGSGTAAGDIGLDVGTLVRDARGRAVGRVQAVRETTQTVLVSIGDRTAELPISTLSADGGFATSTMTKAEIGPMARPAGTSDVPRNGAAAQAGRY